MDVSAYARGALALFNAKSLGVGWSQVADVISPIVDLERWLGAQSNVRSFETVGVSNMTAALAPYITVPSNEVWVLRAASAHFAPGAGASVDSANLAVIPVENTTNPGSGFAIGATCAAASLSRGVSLLAFPNIILTPGTGIGTFAGIVTGVVGANVNVWFDRFRC